MPLVIVATEAMAVDCAQVGQIDYTHKADLPTGVVEVLGFEMAEAGSPFQKTDVIVHKGLPWHRFISARRIGCRLQISIERGGRGYSQDIVDLHLVDGRWNPGPR